MPRLHHLPALLLGLLPAPALAQAPAPAPADCASRAYQDTLVARYLERGAQRVGYLNPQWASYCDSVILRCPAIAQAYQLKAVPLIKDGLYAAAFALEDQAVAHDPRNYLAYRGFLKCVFAKDYAGAIPDFRVIDRLKPNGREMDHTYPFFLALCYLEMGQLALAEAELRRDIALQQGPQGGGGVHYNSYFYQGVVQWEQRRYTLAAQALGRCLAQFPRHPEANYYLALVRRAQGSPAEAARLLAVAVAALAAGIRLNEDNMYYANYPHQITAYEVQQAQRQAQRILGHSK